MEKMVPLYLEDKLSPKETDILLKHVSECKNCKEELTIQYMVSEGLLRAETENNYNLLQGLEDRIKDSVRLVKSNEFLHFAFSFVIICIIFIVVASIMKIMF